VFERVVEHVRGAILSGRLKPGDRLPPERALVRQFRMGRGAVREAFRILEESALIRIRPGKGGGEPIVLRTGVSDALRRHTLTAHRTIVGHLRRGEAAAAKRELSRHLLEIHARITGNGARRPRLGKDSLGA